MRLLFAHKTFPGQYAHLAAALGAAPENDVVFLHAEGDGEIPGVRKIRIKPARAALASTHHYVQSFENAVLLGQAAYRAATQLALDGFRPDLICTHAGFGSGLYLKDAFPGAPLLGYFEWYYRARGSDADFLEPNGVSADDALRIRTRNASLLMELTACDAGIAPTVLQRAQFPRELQGKLTVLHDGIDTDAFHPAAPGAGPRLPVADLPADAEIVTYATRGLEPYRGFPQFMAAIARLQHQRPRLHAVILGEDRTFYGRPPVSGTSHKEATLASLPALDRSRVHFLGPRPLDTYRAVLQGTHVHVYLTVPFVLSWSLLEAMATACPIVASDTAPVREAMIPGATGLLANMRDPASIAKAIAALLDDRDRAARMGSAARRLVQKRYALTQLLPRHLALIRQLAQQPAHRRRPKPIDAAAA